MRKYLRTARPAERSAPLLEQFRFVELARKVVGVGSVGTRAWIVLMLGRDDERSAVPAGQGGGGVGARGVQRAQRSTATTAIASWPGQRLMQAASDILLGWLQHRGRRWTSSATSTSASCATGRASIEIDGWSRTACACTGGCAPGPWRGRTPARVTASRSRHTWAGATSSTARSRASRSLRRSERA